MFKKNFIIHFLLLFLFLLINFAKTSHAFTIFDNIDPPMDFFQKVTENNYNDEDIYTPVIENLDLTSSISLINSTLETDNSFNSGLNKVNADYDYSINVNESLNNTANSSNNIDESLNNIEPSLNNITESSNNINNIYNNNEPNSTAQLKTLDNIKEIDAVIKSVKVISNEYYDKIYSHSSVNVSIEWDTEDEINMEDFIEFRIPTSPSEKISFYNFDSTWVILNEYNDMDIGRAFINDDILTVIFNKNVQNYSDIDKTINFNSKILLNDAITQENAFLTVSTGTNSFDYNFNLLKDINYYLLPADFNSAKVTPIKKDIPEEKNNLSITLISSDANVDFTLYEYALYSDTEGLHRIYTERADENGIIYFDNLNKGTYHLKMVNASENYNVIDDIHPITIEDNKFLYFDISPTNESTLPNDTSYQIPSENGNEDGLIYTKQNPETMDTSPNILLLLFIILISSILIVYFIKLRTSILKSM